MPVGIESRILKRLDEEEAREGSLPPILHFYRRLVAIQSEAKRRLGEPRLDVEKPAAQARLRQGTPLVTFDNLELDRAVFNATFDRVAALFGQYPELFVRMPPSIKGAQVSAETLRACFESTAAPNVIEGAGEDLVVDIVQVTLSPFLERYAEAFAGLVEPEHWRRRYCPICGGKPDFAFLDKSDGARQLVCARCNAGWLFQRLECPHCGCADQYRLAYFTDEAGLYRLYVCEECHRYLKAIDLRQAKGEVLLPLERLLTLDLDQQAREQGYTIS